MNWTGHILVAPRSRLGEALEREEISRTGIYFLVGDDPDRPAKTMIYVGEGDSVAARLKAHARDESKDFWTRACIVTSKDDNLTKAHVRYLEHALVRLARSSDRASVINGNDPKLKSLPEADRADMEFLIDQIETVFPALGFEFLRPKRPVHSRDEAGLLRPLEEDSGLSISLTHISGIEAKAIESDGEIIVLAGSQAQADGNYSSSHSYLALRQQLIDDGVIVTGPNEARLVFAKDYVFKSPSAAAAVIIGRAANGRRNWKLHSGETLGDWQDRQLN